MVKGNAMKTAEPYKIKAIEFINKTTKQYRITRIKDVGYNIFSLNSSDVYLDLLSDSGTGSMTDNQWESMFIGDETYSGSLSYFKLKKTVQEIFGFPYVLPIHQGRAAENILNKIFVKNGFVVPGNKHFSTTESHISANFGKVIDCTIQESTNPSSTHPFKGNIDISLLKKILGEYKKEMIPYILITITCNSVGGQPVSIDNIRKVYNLAKEFDIPVIIDGARYAENAWFIKQREKEFESVSIREIVKEIMFNADIFYMSAKKDALVNIGGFIAMKHKTLFEKCCSLAILYEGFPTSGGLAGRDIEAITSGLCNGLKFDYLTSRIMQTHYLGENLKRIGIPIISPIGGHAVYVHGEDFLNDIPIKNYPSWTLLIELYIESGVRGNEMGAVRAGRDQVTGKEIRPKLDLMRLSIPRMTYTRNHMDVVIEAMEKIKDRKKEILGFEIVSEPTILRHFQCKFRRVKG